MREERRGGERQVSRKSRLLATVSLSSRLQWKAPRGKDHKGWVYGAVAGRFRVAARGGGVTRERVVVEFGWNVMQVHDR